MNKKGKFLVIASIIVVVIFVATFFFYSDKVSEFTTYSAKNFASVFFVDSITVSDLKNRYNGSTSQKINILIVPGHEPNFGGTEYLDLKERDLVVDIANNLLSYLSKDPHYNVMISRDKTVWNPTLQKYFDEHWEEIKQFNIDQKKMMSRYVDGGQISKVTDGVYHNKAPANVGLRILGMNKWANENKIDITLHIHLNDYPRNNSSKPGEYKGFSIYVPDKQYSNSRATIAVAEKIFKRLSTFIPVSNLPKEDVGIVEDQDLIAVGANNSRDGVSMLIEYGYIYEPNFGEALRTIVSDKMAYQTYLGLQDFFVGQGFLTSR